MSDKEENNFDWLLDFLSSRYSPFPEKEIRDLDTVTISLVYLSLGNKK